MSIATDAIAMIVDDSVDRLEGAFEFIDGRFVEKPNIGAESNFIGMVLMTRLWAHVLANRLGLCFAENCGYRIFADDPKRRRLPDGSFVRSGRLPGNKPPRGDMTIPPDLAVEIVSPNDSVEELQARINDFMEAGVLLLWEILPATRQVIVHRADGSMSKLMGNADLNGEDVVPGFVIPLSELFALI